MSGALAAAAAAFDARASSYALAPELAAGDTRDRLLECLDPVADESLLDLACGPGAMTRAAGPFVRRVVAVDLSRAMLRALALESRRAGRLVPARIAAAAHALPFRDATFALVVCRHAARLLGPPAALAREVARVLRRGGRVAIADLMATGDPDTDAVLASLERLREPCDVTLLPPAGWRAVLEAAGLRVDRAEAPVAERGEGRSLLDWCARAGLSDLAFARAKRLVLDAPAGARERLGALVHGEDVVVHPPFGIVAARKTA